MVCPIGLPGITSKLPAAIAASVCAQLLMVWEAQQIAALNDSEPALAPRIALIFEFSFRKNDMKSNLQAYRGSLLHFLADPAFSDSRTPGMKMAC
jgi:hypothetical protein